MYPGTFILKKRREIDIHTKVVSCIICTLFFTSLIITGFTDNVSAQIIEEWVARYNSPGNNDEGAIAIVNDSNGNIYITGTKVIGMGSSEAHSNYITIAYDPSGMELWVAEYDGPANSWDEASAIAISESGQVFVTGRSRGNDTNSDYATIAYDILGNELWVARYNGPGNGWDYAKDMAIDPFGIVYITGESYRGNNSISIATIAYDFFGNEQWIARYNGPENLNDSAYAITLSPEGNVIVTGKSFSHSSSMDYVTVAYDSNGNELWVARYNGPNNGLDEAFAITCDPFNNVFVTGRSPGIGTHEDYATVSYDSLGNERWVARYNGPINSGDRAWAIASDLFGNVYVTGNSYGNRTYKDYTTIKYDTYGNELWIARYNGSKNSREIAKALTIDTSGNIYVTGQSRSGTAIDYATIKYNPDGNVLWVAKYDGPGNQWDSAYAITVDSSGNVYVTGKSYDNVTKYDIATIKYSLTSLNRPPVANAGSSQTETVGVVIEFNGSSSYDPDGYIVNYTWELGDGTLEYGDIVSHLYFIPGNYIINLTVIDNNGAINTDTCYVTILPKILSAMIDIDPNTLNLKSKGRWITCYITLNSPYDVSDIDISTILLEDTLPAEWGDIQGDILMVKFDRSEVEDMLVPGTYNLKVTGEMVDGTVFEGYSDEVRVIDPS